MRCSNTCSFPFLFVITAPAEASAVLTTASAPPSIPRIGAGAEAARAGNRGGCSTTALGFRGCLYLGTYALWERTADGPGADGDSEHAAWTLALRNKLQDRVAGIYLNEVRRRSVAPCRAAKDDRRF